jgi:hypothetical protein
LINYAVSDEDINSNEGDQLKIALTKITSGTIGSSSVLDVTTLIKPMVDTDK